MAGAMNLASLHDALPDAEATLVPPPVMHQRGFNDAPRGNPTAFSMCDISHGGEETFFTFQLSDGSLVKVTVPKKLNEEQCATVAQMFIRAVTAK